MWAGAMIDVSNRWLLKYDFDCESYTDKDFFIISILV